MPVIAEFKLSEYNLFDYMPNWVQPLVGTKEERIAKLSEEGVRVGMKRDVIERPHPRTDWTQVQVIEVAHERNLKYEGLSIAEIAEAEGKEPLDAFIDIALDEDLETEFAHPAGSKSPEAMARVISRPDVISRFPTEGPTPGSCSTAFGPFTSWGIGSGTSSL